MQNKIEKQLTSFLRKEYKPEAIVLAGSRAHGTHLADSDWDVFLLCKREHRGTFVQWQKELLDVSFRPWPMTKNVVLTIPYGPLFPVRILFDGTHGKLQAILKNTEATFHKGPLVAYPAGCRERVQKLNRWQTKLKKHIKHPDIQFYYAGYAYESLVRCWFEQQNLWPLPPATALPYLKKHDATFWKQLQAFRIASPKERIKLFNVMQEKILGMTKTST